MLRFPQQIERPVRQIDATENLVAVVDATNTVWVLTLPTMAAIRVADNAAEARLGRDTDGWAQSDGRASGIRFVCVADVRPESHELRTYRFRTDPREVEYLPGFDLIGVRSLAKVFLTGSQAWCPPGTMVDDPYLSVLDLRRGHLAVDGLHGSSRCDWPDLASRHPRQWELHDDGPGPVGSFGSVPLTHFRVAMDATNVAPVITGLLDNTIGITYVSGKQVHGARVHHYNIEHAVSADLVDFPPANFLPKSCASSGVDEDSFVAASHGSDLWLGRFGETVEPIRLRVTPLAVSMDPTGWTLVWHADGALVFPPPPGRR